MKLIHVRSIKGSDREWINSILEKRWGSANIVTRGKLHQANDLHGFVAIIDNKKVGLITYSLDNDCEIITLDSFDQGKGVGTVLLKKVIEIAKEKKSKRVWVIITNDNLQAFRFYQKRGFVLSALYPNAIERSRKLKPEIPKIGIDNIPIKDEIELEIKF